VVSLFLFVVGTALIVIVFYKQKTQKKVLAYGVTLLTVSLVVFALAIAIFLIDLFANLNIEA
jgi:hypothetical protein